jgi:replicative DNA helicase
VTTRLGRYVDSTLSHPYLTIDGWRKLAELKAGDHIAAPRRMDVFGAQRSPDDEIESLARASRDKIIPPIVFQLARPQLKHFLRTLFGIGLTQGQDGKTNYSTINERHARQMQHLLLRFGVIARLSKDHSAGAAERRSWRLEITDACSLRRVYSEIRVAPQPADAGDSIKPGVKRSCAEPQGYRVNVRQTREAGGGFLSGVVSPLLRQWLSPDSRAGAVNHDRTRGSAALHPGLYSAARICGLRTRQNVGNDKMPAPNGWELPGCDVYWDEIVSIEYLGDKQVYDLTIPETHNFVANDICVHNTAFSLNIAQNAATRPQYNGEKAVVGVFSLEMSNEQLVNRLLCSQARVDAHRLRSGYLSKDEWRRLAVSVGELAETKIFLDDTPGISVLEMRAKARRLKNEQKALDLLIIDYLQLMSGRGRNESRQQEVSQISRELKMLAKELNVPLIALSQLSRAPETRTGSHKPQLSDLRESGSIEQDADVVMFIYREEVYKPETEKQNIAEIIIGKQRNGPIGSVELVFLKQLTRFEDKFNEQA